MLEQLSNYAEYTYLLSTITCTFIILKWFVKESTSTQREMITAIVGIVMGFLWCKIIPDVKIERLILAYFAAVGFYDKIIKVIMTKFKLEYDKDN